MKKMLVVAVAAAMCGTAPVHAQDTNQQMIEAARQMRDLANMMEGSAADDMRKTADDLEASARAEMAEAAKKPAPATPATPEPVAMPGKGENWLADKPSCADFTVSNYQTYRLSGPGDEQLRTLCAGAYNYWAMYERALTTGYTVETARPTWEAYNKAALVADNFYETTKTQ
ncbi:hypothetical protein ACVWZA_003806 [Sphingomonas sp. UYAg733]